MYRNRLLPKYTDEQLRNIYREPHNSENWEDHKIRVRATTSLGMEAGVPAGGSIADLSCGNGLIPIILAEHFDAQTILGDFAPGYTYRGPIEETIDQIPHASLFVCSETIEHLDEPDNVLLKIRRKANRLLLSTPIAEGRDFPVGNPEHYWGWDQEAVGHMLSNTGWHPVLRTDLNFFHSGYPYNYQIWLCR